MRFLRGQARMQDLLILSICITMLVLSILTMLPAFATERLDGNASTLGSLLAASGAGALTSIVFFMPLAQSRKRVGLIMSIAVVWAGVWLLILSTVYWLPLAMLCLFAVSISMPLVVAMSMGLIQVLSPGEMRARLLSLFTMVSFGMQPLSALLVGGASERFGVAIVAAINGALLVLAGLGMIFLRQGLRQWQVHSVPAGMPASR